MQNNTNDDLINTPKFRNIFQQLVDFFKPKKEPAALYEKQDPFEAIAGLNIKAIKNHISLKKYIVWLLVILLITNILSLHFFIQDIFKPNFITTLNQTILKYVLMAYMAIALGISTALINLVGTWPKLLPFGEKKDNVPSNRKSRTENNDDNFDISEYIKEKYQ